MRLTCDWNEAGSCMLTTSAVFRTGDVSDGGVYLQKGELRLGVGDVVIVQIQDVPVEAPRMRMQVMREDSGGYGLRFAE